MLALFRIGKMIPTAEEILCCSNSTTKEKIKLFLQQAILSNSYHHIYCLVCPEKLSYRYYLLPIIYILDYYLFLLNDNVTEFYFSLNNYFIKEFDQIRRQVPRGGYYLAIITAKETSSDIALQYEKKSHMPPKISWNELRTFVYKSILKDPCHQPVDHEVLSGRLLASCKSGNGKTRFARILHEKVGSIITETFQYMSEYVIMIPSWRSA